MISEKHGGQSIEQNLALACVYCNRFKGSDLASLHPATGRLVRFFSPRGDGWTEHFRIDGVRIEPLTEIGEVTARIFEMNRFDRILEREQLKTAGRFPSAAALAHITEFGG